MTKKLILITIDCLRQDHLTLYGYNINTAPNLEQFSKSAYVFNNIIANGSNTPASFYSMFTSTIPTIEGSYTPVPKAKKKIAEVLQEKNIITCAIHSNPHLGKYCNYNMGFDYFFDIFDNPHLPIKRKFAQFGLKLLKLLRLEKYIIKILNKFINLLFSSKNSAPFSILKESSPYSNAKIIVSETIRWLEKYHNSNFFLWIHFMDVHRPYYPPNDYIRKITPININHSQKIYLNELFDKYKSQFIEFNKIDKRQIDALNALYDAEILYVDHYLGVLFDYLKKINIFDLSNIIITSDHGQALLDHNQLSHGVSLYNELLKVPFIMKLNGKFNNREIIENVGELIDLAPTILDIFNLPKLNEFMGISLFPIIKKTKKFNKPRDIISAIYHYRGKMFSAFLEEKVRFFTLISCINDKWKLIYNDENNKVELYNLREDPFELNNLSYDTNEDILQIKKLLLLKINPFIKRYNLEKDIIKKSIRSNILKLL